MESPVVEKLVDKAQESAIRLDLESRGYTICSAREDGTGKVKIVAKNYQAAMKRLERNGRTFVDGYKSYSI